MNKNYGGWLFMYTIVAIASITALVVMISSCNIFKLCKFGWYCILAVLALAIFCIYSAVKLIHEGS